MESTNQAARLSFSATDTPTSPNNVRPISEVAQVVEKQRLLWRRLSSLSLEDASPPDCDGASSGPSDAEEDSIFSFSLVSSSSSESETSSVFDFDEPCTAAPPPIPEIIVTTPDGEVVPIDDMPPWKLFEASDEFRCRCMKWLQSDAEGHLLTPTWVSRAHKAKKKLDKAQRRAERKKRRSRRNGGSSESGRESGLSLGTGTDFVAECNANSLSTGGYSGVCHYR